MNRRGMWQLRERKVKERKKEEKRNGTSFLSSVEGRQMMFLHNGGGEDLRDLTKSLVGHPFENDGSNFLGVEAISVPSISDKGNSHWVPNLGCMGVAPDFPLELLQKFLSFVSSMGPSIVIQEDDTITQHARAFASDGFK
ncbi:hypothetical protein AVEN_153835-1 [Araneus ventricosus]|uniref:Uncharacterized protein n=1 Tax=Araneus ventricosus TaxID=182803 RepID=A0A4Y2Q898_ARAVE|nr:hypothetical protein AVEN_153835-1 [Araneus ventricosus]